MATRAHSEPPAEIAREIGEAILRELVERPPTIGLIGVSGVGKSSTINRLFRTELPTSDSVACTTEFRAVPLQVSYHGRGAEPSTVALRVVDAPGLGEDVRKDEEYLELYRENLPQCDVVLWVMSARNRAVALDQQYLARLPEIHSRVVLGINQVDIVEPRDWSEAYNVPSSAQARTIRAIERDRRERMSHVLGRSVPTVAYSAHRGFRLTSLFHMLLAASPVERQWIYEGLKNFDHRQFTPAAIADNGAVRAAGFLGRLLSR